MYRSTHTHTLYIYYIRRSACIHTDNRSSAISLNHSFFFLSQRDKDKEIIPESFLPVIEYEGNVYERCRSLNYGKMSFGAPKKIEFF